MTSSPLLLLPMLAWSLSQTPEPVAAPRKTADQVKPAEDSPDAGRVTPEQVKLWRMKAAQGDSQAQTNLGLLYSTGDGVPHDPREAAKWFRKAAEQGDGLGQLMLATKYFEGAGVVRDPVKGTAWAILAGQHFWIIFGGGLNSPHITRYLTRVEVKQAIHLAGQLGKLLDARKDGRVSMRMKAAQRDSQAQTNLGLLYSTGDGVPHDPREAVKWFRKAAEQGNGLGQLMLATKYFEGAGVVRDPVKGTAWAILAGEHFRISFGVSLKGPHITKYLTHVEVKQAIHLAAELHQLLNARGALNFGTMSPGKDGRGSITRFGPKPRPEPSPPFAIGIVEASGNLSPIATFDGENWSGIDWKKLAENWRSGMRVKFPGEWTLWYENRGPSPESPRRALSWIDRLSQVRIEIATTGVIEVESPCNWGRILAIATDAGDRSKSLIECDNCCPEPKRGIATTLESPPNLVERLDPEGEDSRRIAARILETFNELENRAFDGTYHNYYDDKTQEFIWTGKTLAEHVEPRLSAEKRNRLPLRFDANYRDATFRVQGVNANYYYIEVRRGYYEQLRAGFPYGALLQGWVRATDDDLVWLTEDFRLTDAEPKAGHRDRPILFWRRGNVVDVLVKRSHWEDVEYIILTIDNDTVNEVVDEWFN